MSNARRREPEPFSAAEETSEKEEEEKSRRISLPQLFVTLQQLQNGQKKWKSLKKCRSLPSSIFSSEEYYSEESYYTMVFEKRGYFYESVGGVFYTLEWPFSKASSTDEVEMPPNIEIDNPEVNKPNESKCGKLIFSFL